MEDRFIRETGVITLSLGLSFCLMCWYFFSLSLGLSILIGAFWGCANLYFLKKLLAEYIKGADKDFLQCFGWLGIKFPLLYLTGYAFLKLEYFSNFGLAGGFTLVFVSIFILAASAIIKQENRVP